MIDLVRARLGDAQAELHARLLALLETAGAAAPAVRAIIADLLCGMFHDHHSPAPMPKAELVDRLAATCAPGSDALCADVLAGRFADAVEAPTGAPPATHRAAPATLDPITLTPAQHRVLTWLCRYHATYSRAPSLAEAAEGCGIHALKVRRILVQLEKRGAARSLGGPRGWYPTREP